MTSRTHYLQRGGGGLLERVGWLSVRGGGGRGDGIGEVPANTLLADEVEIQALTEPTTVQENLQFQWSKVRGKLSSSLTSLYSS